MNKETFKQGLASKLESKSRSKTCPKIKYEGADFIDQVVF